MKPWSDRQVWFFVWAVFLILVCSALLIPLCTNARAACLTWLPLPP
jgi:hypothetical protein